MYILCFAAYSVSGVDTNFVSVLLMLLFFLYIAFSFLVSF